MNLGFSLVELATGTEVTVVHGLPARIALGKATVDFDKPDQVMPDSESPTHRLVERVLSAAPPTQPHQVGSETAIFDGERMIVTREYALLPPRRRSVDKATILHRLSDAQLAAALALMTERQKERWRVPGRPSIHADDPELLAVLKAIGADPTEVLAE